MLMVRSEACTKGYCKRCGCQVIRACQHFKTHFQHVEVTEINCPGLVQPFDAEDGDQLLFDVVDKFSLNGLIFFYFAQIYFNWKKIICVCIMYFMNIKMFCWQVVVNIMLSLLA